LVSSLFDTQHLTKRFRENQQLTCGLCIPFETLEQKIRRVNQLAAGDDLHRQIQIVTSGVE